MLSRVGNKFNGLNMDRSSTAASLSKLGICSVSQEEPNLWRFVIVCWSKSAGNGSQNLPTLSPCADSLC